MDDNKKFIIANRCSFILFVCYLLTYIILPIYAKDARYLIFLIFPVIFLISLLVNLSLKYDKLNTNKLDWEEKNKQTKKYPSIEPAWIFVIMFTTILYNFIIFALMLSLEDLNLILKFSIISLAILALCQITSSFSLYYKNGKKEVWKFWRNIIIVVLGLILIFGLSGGFKMITDEYNNMKEQEELKEHIDNINSALEDIRNN